MKINKGSAWSKDEILNYLNNANTPLRISCNDSDGYPIICSLWFIHKDGVLWAASHKNAHVVKVLQSTNKIGLEIATNEMPYQGIRGKATVELIDDSAGKVLSQLINKYLGSSNTQLANWLLSRSKDEYALKIVPKNLNSWDFSHRMRSL